MMRQTRTNNSKREILGHVPSSMVQHPPLVLIYETFSKAYLLSLTLSVSRFLRRNRH